MCQFPGDPERSRIADQLLDLATRLGMSEPQEYRVRRAAAPKDPHVHRMPPAPGSAVFTGPVYGPVTVGGGHAPEDPLAGQVAAALHQVLARLPEAGLEADADRAVREEARAALETTRREPGQRRRLRTAVSRVCQALVTGAASGTANPVVAELTHQLLNLPY
ncbi:hypothetical protein [Saccharopolyspora cebuensis]|uniref:Uncharacterized protein n=1 Tax=Saccharopolyspora cebuensis TaxID=418759 RepID=A0ABV4CAZ9_9PSEU